MCVADNGYQLDGVDLESRYPGMFLSSVRTQGGVRKKIKHITSKFFFKASRLELTERGNLLLNMYKSCDLVCYLIPSHFFCRFLRLSDTVHDSQTQFCILKSSRTHFI